MLWDCDAWLLKNNVFETDEHKKASLIQNETKRLKQFSKTPGILVQEYFKSWQRTVPKIKYSDEKEEVLLFGRHMHFSILKMIIFLTFWIDAPSKIKMGI